MARPTAPNDVTDEDITDDLIRSVMVEQKRVRSRDVLPELEPVEMEPSPPEKKKLGFRFSRSEARDENPPKAKRAKTDIAAKLKSYRPKRSHVVFAVLALIVVWRPWLIPGILFVSFWVALIAWLTLGPDRMTELLHSGWEKLAKRKPELAEKLRQSADRFALRFDAFLNKLPERWAEKLALPDMSAPVKTGDDLEDRPDPFDRLKLPEVYRG